MPDHASIVIGMLDRLTSGGVELALPDGSRRTLGAPQHGVVRLDVRDPAFFSRVLRGASVGAGDSYMDGQWSSDDLVGLLRTVIADRAALARLSPGAIGQIVLDRARHLARDNRRAAARRNIAAHYDLSNAFYATFLDETMTYSSAVFATDQDSLADAQRNKYTRLIELARIDADCHVLEIGCGWGGFAIHAATTTGCRVTGITLSQAQADEARRRVDAVGLADRVAIELGDYRDVAGTYDRVVSIEMLEAVGHRHLDDYFGTIERVLTGDGLAAFQVITIPEQRYARYRRRPDFIQQRIFPGGHLPSLESMVSSLRRSSSMFVESVDNIGIHYAETLRRWRVRFLAQRDRIGQLGFDERFQRMWEFYLAYCEAAFRARYINDMQFVVTRTGNPTLESFPYQESV
ncbi:MAG: cyclopropane-fatty-acyl-phospholipid synthase family protein [Nitriliruptoraceae bacterium]